MWAPTACDRDGRITAFRVYADAATAWQIAQLALEADTLRIQWPTG
jgi:hypothetical protein